ncbi:MAG: polysaccharide deacetylase family protein [Dehalococcoidia bacterium]
MRDIGFEYSPIIARDVLKWPGDARLAVWVGVAVEHHEFDLPTIGGPGMVSGSVPDVRNYSARDYGPRVGIWRLMDLLDRFDIPTTAFLNSSACDHYPIIIDEARKRDWEFMAHGVTNSKILTGLPEEEERGVIRGVIQRITDAVGKRPQGWIGPGLAETFNTRDILVEEGIRYVCDWCNDDQPYLMRAGKGRLMSVPYSVELNDLPAFTYYHLSPESFYQMVRDQFDVLYEEGKTNGRVMSIGLHPNIVGVPFRIKCLERILKHITNRKDVWLATPSEIVDWCDEHYFKEPA